MTLLLGPPGCGKSTFLKALSGNLNKSLEVCLFILQIYLVPVSILLNEIMLKLVVELLSSFAHSYYVILPQVTGEVSYNGYKLEDFIASKVSAYVSQHDQHIPEMTVRETLDFSARCQGVGNRAGLLFYLLVSSFTS